ncbi:MAG: hypothetical protein H9W81_03360 [Enterococcus sp.]|nr:hypothetical protein [Enterococcus sp.]
MNSNLSTVVEQINIFLDADLSPASNEVLHAYMEILNTCEGTDEKKLNHLSEYIDERAVAIMSSSDPTASQIKAMAVHAFFTEMIGELAKASWEKEMLASKKS